jgi:hypothetical protein
MARLDRLASVRHVAQIGAAIGREFSFELLRAVSHLPEDELHAALTRLVASELVFQRGTPADAVFAFKHALVQDTAHGSLLRNARQQLHAQIAEALETDSSELIDSQPELFAQYYAEAGLTVLPVLALTSSSRSLASICGPYPGRSPAWAYRQRRPGRSVATLAQNSDQDPPTRPRDTRSQWRGRRLRRSSHSRRARSPVSMTPARQWMRGLGRSSRSAKQQ